MKKAKHLVKMAEQCRNQCLPDNKRRQVVINMVTERILSERCPEEEAVGMFFWSLASLDQPVNREEQMLFSALFLTCRSSCETMVDSEEKALEILELPKENLNLPWEDLMKETKKAYWRHFNELSRDLKDFLRNAKDIGAKKSAYIFLQSQR